MPGEGGAGGKIRKKPSRQSPTKPYDRPLNATRGSKNSRWLSKIVDPASKIITLGANRLFDSVFKKRLTTNLQLPSLDQEQNSDLHDTLPETSPHDSAASPETENVQPGGVSSGFQSPITELEQLLKRRSFTRSEIDRLTQLVNARTFDVPGDNKGETPEGSCSKLLTADVEQEKNQRLYGSSSIPTSRVIEDDIASPAELAKAYMGSRTIRLSPPALGFRPLHLKEETPLVTTSEFHPKASMLRSKAQNLGPDINFLSPRSRGRSFMHNMAHTPYSKPQLAIGDKGTGVIFDDCKLSSHSQSSLQQNGASVSRRISLKRRYSVLDDDFGTIHPINRLSKKPNLVPLKVNEFALSVTDGKNASLDTPRKQEENKSIDMGLMSVPSKSSRTAAKIFKHLETMTPKSQSVEAKLLAAKGKSPMLLKESMLNGKSLKSPQTVEPPDMRQDLDLRAKASSSGSHQKGDKIEGHELLVVEHDKQFSTEGSSSACLAESRILSSKDFSMLPSVDKNSLKKKRGFVMSADVDDLYMEIDVGDVPLNSSYSSLVDAKEKANVANESKALAPENGNMTISLHESNKSIPGEESVKKAEETSPTSVVTTKSNGFSLPIVSTPGTTGQTSLFAPSTMPSVPNISAISSEGNVAHALTFQSLSSTSASGLHFSAGTCTPPHLKAESLNRNGVEEGGASHVCDIQGSPKDKAAKLPSFGMSDKAAKWPSFGISSIKSETTLQFPVFDVAVDNQEHHNGQAPSFPSLFSPATASSSLPAVVTASPPCSSAGRAATTIIFPAFAFDSGTSSTTTLPSTFPTFAFGSKATSPFPVDNAPPVAAPDPLTPSLPAPEPSKPEPTVSSGLAVAPRSNPSSLPSNVPAFPPIPIPFGGTGPSASASIFGSVGAPAFPPSSASTGSSFSGFAFGATPTSTVLAFGGTSSASEPTLASPPSFSFGNTTTTSSSVSLPVSAVPVTPGSAPPPASQSSTPFSFTFGTASSSGLASPFSFASPPVAFGSSPSITAPSGFVTTPSPAFGGSSSSPAFNPFQQSNSSDNMNAEDTMVEDTMQQQASPPPPGFAPPPFTFGMGGTPSPSVFPTFGQPGEPAPVPLFAAVNPMGGGSFAVGASGEEKKRKMVKISRNKYKRR